ncbi:MAG: ABC-2 family transporter protein [Herbinix sp.]|nr:ABC-2 family transporter protein [Herbinix sp.]
MKNNMGAIKKKLNILWAVAVVTYKEWSAYRTHSMVSILVGPIYFIVQYFIWTAAYGGKTQLNGMDLTQMITYFGASTLIGYLTMDFADWNLQMLIRTGRFLTFALRPIHHRFFAFSQKVGHRVLGLVFEFIPCYIIFTLLFKVSLVPTHIGWTILSVMLAFLMNFYIHYILGMTAFWFTQSTGIRRVFDLLSGVFSGVFIPLVFFPQALQKILFFLPFPYMSYVPVMVFTGDFALAGIQMDIPVIVGIQGLAVCITILISEVVYRASMRRFNGVGA